MKNESINRGEHLAADSSALEEDLTQPQSPTSSFFSPRVVSMTDESEKQVAQSIDGNEAGPTPTDGFAPKPATDDSKASKKEKKNKGPPPGVVIKPKPKLTKAERREIQERQRAAKAGKQQPQNAPAKGGSSGGKAAEKKPQQQQQAQAIKNSQQLSSGKSNNVSNEGNETVVVQDNSLSLFSHLPQYRGNFSPGAKLSLSSIYGRTHRLLYLCILCLFRNTKSVRTRMDEHASPGRHSAWHEICLQRDLRRQ